MIRLIPYTSTFWLTRLIFIRGLGAICFIANLVLILQYKPLIGKNGLTPAYSYLNSLIAHFGGGWEAFFQIPSIFYLNASDMMIFCVGTVGLIISVCMIIGSVNGVMILLLWLLYMSIVNVGQVFYSFGWEMMMLECLFLTIFSRKV